METLTFSDKALRFYKTLAAPGDLPPGIEVMNPYQLAEVQEYTRRFLEKFFSDRRDRVFVFGINPGRFGSGLTGVTFTDPVALEKFCGIPNTLEKRREISSEFVYRFIEHWGGAQKFYNDFFLTAVSPLGFTRSGRNYNYYDDPALFDAIKPFIVETLGTQLDFGARREVVILFGIRQNQRFFLDLNKEYGFFKKIFALEHPRYIMQYKRRYLPEYLKKYEDIFSQALS